MSCVAYDPALSRQAAEWLISLGHGNVSAVRVLIGTEWFAGAMYSVNMGGNGNEPVWGMPRLYLLGLPRSGIEELCNKRHISQRSPDGSVTTWYVATWYEGGRPVYSTENEEEWMQRVHPFGRWFGLHSLESELVQAVLYSDGRVKRKEILLTVQTLS